MIKVKKGNQTIEVTEKAFKVVYEPLGFVKVTTRKSKASDNE